MVLELIFRFIVGGLVVCFFAVLGEVFRPTSLGGISGAAPSVGLATLGLTFFTKGNLVSSIEGRSMMIGAAALCVYSLVDRYLVPQRSLNTLATTAATGVAWFAVAFGLWALVLQ
jgi:hypothetical protein